MILIAEVVQCSTKEDGGIGIAIRDFAFFVFERTKHQPRRNLRNYLVLQRPCNEAALSPGIDAFWY